nr:MULTISPECIES: hypothetical protein [unclassified Acinetobacter]
MHRPDQEQILKFLRLSNDVGRRAMQLGHHPFGAILIAPDHETILLTQCNIDTVNHAESTLARVAATNYPADYGNVHYILLLSLAACVLEPFTGPILAVLFMVCQRNAY